VLSAKMKVSTGSCRCLMMIRQDTRTDILEVRGRENVDTTQNIKQLQHMKNELQNSTRPEPQIHTIDS